MLPADAPEQAEASTESTGAGIVTATGFGAEAARRDESAADAEPVLSLGRAVLSGGAAAPVTPPVLSPRGDTGLSLPGTGAGVLSVVSPTCAPAGPATAPCKAATAIIVRNEIIMDDPVRLRPRAPRSEPIAYRTG